MDRINAWFQGNPRGRVLYFVLLALLLFVAVYRPSTVVYKDSYEFIGRAERAPEDADPTGKDLSDITLLDFLVQYHRHGPFLYPFLIRILGGTAQVQVFQNIVRSFSWALLCLVAASKVRGNRLRVVFHLILVGLAVYLTYPYANAILTEDLNLSWWVLYAALACGIVMRTDVLPLWAWLLLHDALLGLLLSTRDSNLVGVLFVTGCLHGWVCLVLWRPKPSWKGAATVGGSFLLSLVFVAVAKHSIDANERYLWTLTNQMDFHMGPPYTPATREEYPILYRHDIRDSAWFFENYPELRTIPPPSTRWEKLGHPFIKYQRENVQRIWTHYVLDHFFSFAHYAYRYMQDFVNFGLAKFYLYPFFNMGALLSTSALMFVLMAIHRPKVLVYVAFLYALAFLDFFIATVGDWPGEIRRHGNVALALLPLAFTMLCAHTADILSRKHILVRETHAEVRPPG